MMFNLLDYTLFLALIISAHSEDSASPRGRMDKVTAAYTRRLGFDAWGSCLLGSGLGIQDRYE